ncbi:MAG: IPT/TIG domain-containing protein [Methanoregula sp.]
MRWIPVSILILAGLLLIGGVSASEFGPWSFQTVDSYKHVGQYSSVALDAAGNPAISYYDQTYGDLKYASWDGTRWNITTVDCSKRESKNKWFFWDRSHDSTQTPEYLSCFHGTQKVGKYSSLAFDNNGKPRISYYDESNKNLLYAAWDGTKWVIETVDGSKAVKGHNWKNWDGDHNRIDDRSVKVGQYTSLAFDNTGKPRISYYDESKGDLKYASWDGSKWILTTVDGSLAEKGRKNWDNDRDRVDTRSVKVGEYSSLALDSSNKPSISYYDETNKNLKYAAWDGSKWVIETVDGLKKGEGQNKYHWDGDHNRIDDRSRNVGKFSSLALDSSGKPCISYYDQSDKNLLYAAWDGNQWNITTVDSSKRVGEYASLALDANGNPRISYYDASHRDLKFASWNSTNSIWVTETVDSSGKVGSFTSLVLDSQGAPGISYYDQSNKDLKYAAGKGQTQTPTAPIVTGISPASGPVSGGTVVTITGTGFTGATNVIFGDYEGTNPIVNSDTSISITSPANQAGTVHVTVITLTGGSSATSPADQFTYIVVPTITSISPVSGPDIGGTVVTITGTSLNGATAVTFDGTPASTFSVINETSISATSPAHAAGAVNVNVTTPNGAATGTYTYITLPTVTDISPASGPVSGGTVVTITGTNLIGTNAVTFDGTPATASSAINETSISATSPAHAAGAVSVVVTTPNGTATGTYTYVIPPTVTGISPARGPASGDTVVTISGTNLNGATTVTFDGIPATAFSADSDTTITATTPAHAAGAVNVVVTTLTGAATGTYTYIGGPTVSSITPATGVAGELVTITDLAGTNFVEGTTPEVWLAKTGEKNINATNVFVVNPNQITCTIQLAPYSNTLPGKWDVGVKNSDGQSGSQSALFTLTNPAPLVSSIEPNSGINGTIIHVVNVTGQNFGFGTNPIIWLSKDGQSDIMASDVHIYGTTSLDFLLNIPVTAEAGVWDLHVRSQDGQTTAYLGQFTVISGLPEGFIWDWTTDGWDGWTYSSSYSGTESYSVIGPDIVSGNGIYGVSLPAGTRNKVVTSTVSKTFTAPAGSQWSTLTFNGLLSSSDNDGGRSLNIKVNSLDVYPETTAATDPTLNGQQEFTITKPFDRANEVIVTIISKGTVLKKTTFVYTTQFNSLTLS